ncbi:MAG TPA: nodulation protein NfeD, partial [Candidatus Dormibacteraeota bacterium]|nr:nodulation protein NfeD [Candidatus Dormibacteraeota bacterium]
MKYTAIRAFLLAAFAGLVLSSSVRAGDVVVLTYAGPINAISAEYISRGITKAESRHASALILQLDTPGGFDSAMRKIVQ